MNARGLKCIATRAAHWRGHKRLSRWEWSWGKLAASRHCLDCGAWLQIEPKPAPNGIDIGGSAVAEGCKWAKP